MASSPPHDSPPDREPDRRVDGRRERWRRHRETRRAELITAALAAVERLGPGVGVDDIAGASGIAKPVFYRYFTDKADLFRAMGREIAETVVGQVMAAIDAAERPREKLAAGIDAYVRCVEGQPEIYRFAARHQVTEATSADPLGDYASVVGQHATVVIGEILRAQGVDSGAAEPWGFGIVGMVRTATDRWLESPTMSRAALVDYLTALTWPGLASAAGRPAPASRAVTSRHAHAVRPVRSRAHRAGDGRHDPGDPASTRDE